MWWQRLRGWRTVIFSGFLVALGIVLSGLSALDVVQLQVILPASLKPFAPMILAMVGAAVMYLRIITTTAAYPGLPLITANTTTDADITRLQSVLRALCTSDEAAPTLQALHIIGFEQPAPAAYQRCIDMRRHAQALGYPLLA
jgi:hypothetical protein